VMFSLFSFFSLLLLLFYVFFCFYANKRVHYEHITDRLSYFTNIILWNFRWCLGLCHIFNIIISITVNYKNSLGDEIANVNFLTTISHTRRPTSKYRKRDKLDDR